MRLLVHTKGLRFITSIPQLTLRPLVEVDHIQEGPHHYLNTPPEKTCELLFVDLMERGTLLIREHLLRLQVSRILTLFHHRPRRHHISFPSTPKYRQTRNRKPKLLKIFIKDTIQNLISQSLPHHLPIIENHIVSTAETVHRYENGLSHPLFSFFPLFVLGYIVLPSPFFFFSCHSFHSRLELHSAYHQITPHLESGTHRLISSYYSLVHTFRALISSLSIYTTSLISWGSQFTIIFYAFLHD